MSPKLLIIIIIAECVQERNKGATKSREKNDNAGNNCNSTSPRPNFCSAYERNGEKAFAGRDRGLKALEGDDGLCLPVMSKHPRALCHHSW